MECGAEIAATEFLLSYLRATEIQASLAAVGLLSFIVAWLAGRFLWVVAGVLLGSIISFTLIAILPTNKQGALRSGGARNAESIPQYFDFRPTENA
jgi:energy-coupling factor transporter transmembrane protein EcfT